MNYKLAKPGYRYLSLQKASRHNYPVVVADADSIISTFIEKFNT